MMNVMKPIYLVQSEPPSFSFLLMLSHRSICVSFFISKTFILVCKTSMLSNCGFFG
ncbi:hypothetical protein HanXRQr2_Chr14g0666161 [Helianthus annuus]|uniref:Uncharacterized protein n=1 Tax=Helianthus annuus TaxID=4232 RepID=A0A9K3ECP1_HELAN|nr:hypothetical protein HanXRQr2_Chr14g0666161 [Helianthus annuus]KAJ0842228.1 hypothetical protein HanPSC8_Chr14g0639261 [Helianthus annuus]